MMLVALLFSLAQAITPPQPVDTPPAITPEGVTQPATVVLLVTIGADGTVQNVGIAGSGGPALDAAAIAVSSDGSSSPRCAMGSHSKRACAFPSDSLRRHRRPRRLELRCRYRARLRQHRPWKHRHRRRPRRKHRRRKYRHPKYRRSTYHRPRYRRRKYRRLHFRQRVKRPRHRASASRK